MKNVYSKWYLGILAGLVFFSALPAGAQSLTVDLSKEYQIIRGFGGIHINSWTGQQLTEDFQEKAFDNDPGEMGLSIFRMWVDPNSSGWNAELPVAKYATSKGALVFASPWNPPAHMKEFLRTFEKETDYRLLPEYYGAYVDHLNSFIDHMNNNGVPLYAISVQNEPDWHGWTWWEPNEMLKFVRENAQNINCRVIAPESLGYVRKMIDPLLKDSVANSHIDILGTHLYGTPKTNFYYPLAYEKGKEIWMTEHLFGSDKPADNTWALALTLADEINTCMDARMSAFVYWYLRRFYGLIDETGNITDKGFVMSHYAKFIRPGSHRVDMKFNVATNVTATAFKNDSTVVMVVVNRSNQSVPLNFDIQNNIAGVDSMTQFTTTTTKRVVNSGTFKIENGAFAVTVEPMSITTFTSDPRQGGKFGNQAPIAAVGGDLEVLDATGSGAKISLKGSESTDADGQIVKYTWARDGYQISTSADLDVTLGIGTYNYVLTVTDNDGATATKTVTVNVFNHNTTELWFEAECAANEGSNWNVIEHAAVSGGKYLMVKDAFQSTASATADTLHHLVFNFKVEEAGTYKVWGRVLAPTADDDSFWVRLNDGDWVNWNSIPGGSSWAWDDVHNQADANPMLYTLEPGDHKLYVCYRENGAGIDKFYITNTGNTPTGLGGEAANCVVEEPEIPNNVENLGLNNEVKVYPNPAKSNFRIESREPISSVRIFNGKGSLVFSKVFEDETTTETIQLNVDSGIYFLQTVSQSKSIVTKLIIEN